MTPAKALVIPESISYFFMNVYLPEKGTNSTKKNRSCLCFLCLVVANDK